MNADHRERLTDLKAAVRLGHAESIWTALDGVADLPEISSNAAVSDALIDNLLLPMGAALAQPSVPAELLTELAETELAAMRAVAAAALAARWRAGNDAPGKTLAALGRDNRVEVRRALSETLRGAPGEQLHALLANWLNVGSARLRETAIRALPALDVPDALALLRQLAAESDPDARAALAATLTELAQREPHAVLDLLVEWAGQPAPPAWVIAETLSGSWAAAAPDAALDILEPLGAHPEALRRVLRALLRHCATTATTTRLAAWRTGASPQLKNFAETFDHEQD